MSIPAHDRPVSFASDLAQNDSALSPSAVTGALVIAVLTMIVYLPAVRSGFFLDDHQYIADNPLIAASDGLVRFWTTLHQQEYYPLSYSVLWVEWRLWSDSPAGYHAVNIALHILSALLLWNILRKLAIPGAFLAAVLFAVHPINVESVAWIFQCRGLLAMMFFLLSIVWFLRADEVRVQSQGNASWFWLSLLAFVAAMLCKGSVAVLPLVLLLIVWWKHRRINIGDLARAAPFFIAAIVLTAVILWVREHGTGGSLRSPNFAERLAGAGAIVWFSLSKACLPIRLSVVYQFWIICTGELLWWLPIMAVVALTVALCWQRNAPTSWVRSVRFAWGYFCIGLIPVLGFAETNGITQVADRYLHLALIGVLALVAAGWSYWRELSPPPLRWRTTAYAVVVTSVFSALSYHQTSLFGNPIDLFEIALASNSTAADFLHGSLAYALAAKGRFHEAVAHYRAAIKINPEWPDFHFNLANALSSINQRQEAIEEYQRALELLPSYCDAHTNLAIALAGEGRLQEAIEHYQQAVKINPNMLTAQNNLGNALARAGRLEEALPHLEAAVRLKPDSASIHNNLGVTLADLGRFQEAIDQYRNAIQLDATYAAAYFNLAKASAQLSRSAEAMSAAQKSLDLAQSTGPTALIRQIEDWLKNYRASLSNSSSGTARPESSPPTP